MSRKEHIVELCADCPDPVVVDVERIVEEFSEGGASVRAIEDAAPKTWGIVATVEKYAGEWTAEQIASGEAGPPYEIYTEPGNLLMNVGSQRIIDRLISNSTQAMDNTHTFIGVGDVATAESAAQTDLAASTGSTHRQWVGMDASHPVRSGQVLTVKGTFTSLQGNFTAGWLEWAIEIDNGTSSPGTAALSTGTQKMLNRKVPSGGMGVKTSGNVWVLSIAITII